jgi:hypothetical protein
MNERTARLRQASLDTPPSVSEERACLLTDFYKANEGRDSVPVTRARSFAYLCEHKTIYLGQDELIVGERGPQPKSVPTYPELTCHSTRRSADSEFAAQDAICRSASVSGCLPSGDHPLLARPGDAGQDLSRDVRGLDRGV